MSRPPLLSVVTIAFNSARTIADTFASIRAQRDPRFEYIVVDGGSTDGTLDLLEANRDIVDAWISEPDRGTSDAANKGGRMATGTWLWFVNSDDHLEPGAMAAVLERLEAADPSEPLMLIGSTRVISSSGETLTMFRCDAAALERVLEYNPIPYPSTILSRALFLQLGGFGSSYEIINDYDFYLRALETRPRIAFLDRVLANMRDGGQSTSSASLSNRLRHHIELIRLHSRYQSPARVVLDRLTRLARRVLIVPMRRAIGPRR